jgi:hypothetical protein
MYCRSARLLGRRIFVKHKFILEGRKGNGIKGIGAKKFICAFKKVNGISKLKKG